jgi:hypothetical protein
MAKHQWSILCRRSIIDREDNTISIIEALEGVTTYGPPIKKEELGIDIIEKSEFAARPTPLGVQLVTLWIRSNVEKPEVDFGRVLVKSPDGKTLINQEYEINLNKATRTRTKMQFLALPFAGIGAYSYITQQKKGTKKKSRWVTVSELFFDMKQMEPAKA